MKFNQLIKYVKRNIFLKSHTQNVVEILFSDPFSKNQNWAYFWINSVKFYIDCFIVCQVEDYQKILKLSCRSLAFTSYKAFLKTKRGLELVSLANFMHDFWSKMFILLYSIAWPNFIVWLRLLREILSNIYIVNVC